MVEEENGAHFNLRTPRTVVQVLYGFPVSTCHRCLLLCSFWQIPLTMSLPIPSGILLLTLHLSPHHIICFPSSTPHTHAHTHDDTSYLTLTVTGEGR